MVGGCRAELYRSLEQGAGRLHDRLAVRPRELAENSSLELIFIHSQHKMSDPWRHHLCILQTHCNSTLLFLNDNEPFLIVGVSFAAA